MSVLIKGLHIPDKCIDCRFFAGRWCYVIPNPEEQPDRLPLNGKPEWCPLIPVPPHGRLIDADDVDNHIIGHVDLRGCPTIIPAEEG